MNELVKKFPERQPPAKTAPQEKILELIQQWNFLLHEDSKYKQDLAHINDMYRLLQYKGYTFPTLKEDAALVMKPAETFKTKDELEAEDREAQAAVSLDRDRF